MSETFQTVLVVVLLAVMFIPSLIFMGVLIWTIIRCVKLLTERGANQ